MAERDLECTAQWGGRAGADDRFEAVFTKKELDIQRRKQFSKVMGGFVVLCVAVVATAVIVDSMQSHTSREILLREAQFDVSKLVQAKSKQGGLKALGRFATKLTKLEEDPPADNATATSVEDVAEGKEEAEGAAAAESESEPKSIATDAPDRKEAPGMMQPGWGQKSSWGAADWTIWVVLGPVATIIAVVFMYYMYGWQAALSLCLVLLIVDVFAFYLNI